MNSTSPALLLALLLSLCALCAEASSLTRYEKSLKAVCDYLIAKGPPTDCGRGNDGCQDDIKDQLNQTCNPDYGSESGCSCSGRWISREAAVTRIARGSSYNDPDVKKDLCLAQDLSKVYNEQMENNTGILKMFTGFPSGAHYSYPASNWKQERTDPEEYCRSKASECPDYDPRTRRWWYAAAVGPKNVVLLLDSSGSMNKTKTISRMDLLKNAAKAVIDTLTLVDYLGIITFSDSTQSWKGDALQPANKKNRDDAKTWISAQAPKGGTDFKMAFTKTHELISRSFQKDSATRCKTAILFLTDGESDTDPWEAIEDLQKETDVFVLTYTLGNEAKQEVPRSIACRTRGVHQHIEDNGDLSAAMTTYGRVLAGGHGGSQDDNKVRGSEPYEDHLSLGEVISPALKCQKDGRLIAVAALTINKQRDPEIFKSNFENIATECVPFSISREELEAIRDHSCEEVRGMDRPGPTTLRPLTWILIFLGVLVLLLPGLAAAAVAFNQRRYDLDDDHEGRKKAREHNFTGQAGRYIVAVVSCPGGPDRKTRFGQGEMFADLICMEGLAVTVVFVRDEGMDVFWRCYHEALQYAVGKTFLVVITKQDGSIGNVQREEVLLLDSCRGEDGLPNFHQDDVHLVAMKFKEFKAWAREEFRERDLGCTLRQAFQNEFVKRLPSIAEMEARFTQLPRIPRRRPGFTWLRLWR